MVIKSSLVLRKKRKTENNMDLGHWILRKGLQVIDEPFGFIYQITNNAVEPNKKYIGKKQCISKIRRKPLKGKTRNRLDTKESDWKTYTGSSKELNEDIKKFGKENFTFTILEWCNSKFELGYKEIKLQLQHDVILNENYYNGIINCRLGRPPKNFKL
jgi:hypothetical protein